MKSAPAIRVPPNAETSEARGTLPEEDCKNERTHGHDECGDPAEPSVLDLLEGMELRADNPRKGDLRDVRGWATLHSSSRCAMCHVRNTASTI